MKPTQLLAGAALVLAGALGMWILMPKQQPAAAVKPAVPAPAAAPSVPVPELAAVALPVEPEKPKPEPVVKKAVPKPRRSVVASVRRQTPAPAPARAAEPVLRSAPEAVSKPAEALESQPTSVTRETSKPSVPEPPPLAPIAPPKLEPRSVTIPAGTLIAVRLNEKVSTATHYQNDTVQCTLDAPLVVNGMVLAERGSRQLAKVVLMEPPGRVKGKATIALELAQLRTSDGQSIDVSSETFTHTAASSAKKDATKVGVLAGIGAAIGAIAGGGKGAAIGAGVGGAAGAGTVLGTKGEQAELENETRLTFKLKQPVTLTEKLK